MKKLNLNKKVIAQLNNPDRILGGEDRVTCTQQSSDVEPCLRTYGNECRSQRGGHTTNPDL